MTEPVSEARLAEILAEELKKRGINGTPISYFEAALDAMRRAVEEALAQPDSPAPQPNWRDREVTAGMLADGLRASRIGELCLVADELQRLAALDSTPPATADAGGRDD